MESVTLVLRLKGEVVCIREGWRKSAFWSGQAGVGAEACEWKTWEKCPGARLEGRVPL